MVLHNDKWKKKANKKHHNKKKKAPGLDLKGSLTRKTNISSEDDNHDSHELPSNSWKYEGKYFLFF